MAVTPLDADLPPERRARALADPTRLALMELVTERARPVSELARCLGVPAGRLYHHLDILEASGLVRLRQIRPKRLYEAVPPFGLGSQVLDETDRLELMAAAFELVRANAESAHRRAEEGLRIGVHSVFLTPAQLEALTAEVSAVIERWLQTRRSRGARRTRLIFGAVPLPLELAEATSEQPGPE
jgi:DNA-binding transcriptional ArsR family regulator